MAAFDRESAVPVPLTGEELRALRRHGDRVTLLVFFVGTALAVGIGLATGTGWVLMTWVAGPALLAGWWVRRRGAEAARRRTQLPAPEPPSDRPG